MEAADGAIHGTTENVYLDIPLATVRQLTDGRHTISVQGQGRGRQLGPCSGGTLNVDKTGPAHQRRSA